MAKKFYDPQECVGFMTYTTSRLLSATLHRYMEKMGLELTSEQWGMLVQLFNRGNIHQEEITRASGVDKSTTSRSLGLMERRGLIVRNTDPADTRRKILSLTPKAQAIKEDSLQAVQNALAQALKGVDPKERRICLQVLGQVKKNLQELITRSDE
ncbi:MAG: MarR family transcriptional regulator [Desulfovibrionales bacterium]|nr:MarR family transcriptional regulator [Desulfovibrionales bacterium]